MDFSKLLNAIRGNKAADASAAPKDRPESETVIPVEVSPTVAAADHPPPLRPSGGVVQSLLGPFTGGNREPASVSSQPPQVANGPQAANGYDDDLASVLPSSPLSSAPSITDSPLPISQPTSLPGLSASSPLDGDWFDVPFGHEPRPAATGSEVSVLDLPPEAAAPTPVNAQALEDLLMTAPSVAPPADPFEVSGKIDLSWTPTETSPPETGVLDSSTSLGAGMESPPLPSSAVGTPTALSPPSIPPPPIINPLADFEVGGYTAPPLPTGILSSGEAHTDSGEAQADHLPVEAAAPPAPSDLDPAVEGMAPPLGPAQATYADWIIEYLDEALIVLDAQSVICQLNPMAEYLLGGSRTDLCGRTLLDVSQQAGDNAPLWEHLAVTSEAQQFSTTVTLPDGQPMMASFVVCDLPPQSNWTGGRVIAIRDETRIRAEVAQMMETLTPPPQASALNVTPEQLAAMHTSLQMVLGFAELLHRGEYGPMNPQQFEMFRNIEHHAKQLAGWLGLPQG
ncbi:MAG: PAS domain-containing protein [Chloracidobacterium sp.]|uniref:PAS domain-containing protein n=1 Tax=Chloracidobacterium validum TaxID=2821543 RepID=A0ABX8BA30_9BACT|nr:PAS domain-containing protein [Chloracidobacterium validum]QUW03526.1 PAS domain-containing protein [Chloracidobacterium validum]